MAVITMACPKGGVGKTTLAMVLAGELIHAGRTVTVIDGDPNMPFKNWKTVRGCHRRMTVRSEITEDTIIDEIEAGKEESDLVIVDLEGSAGLMVTYAITRSDLVLVPIQGSVLDRDQGIRAVRLIRRNEKALERKIPFTIVGTRTNTAVQGRTQKHTFQELVDAGLDFLGSQLIEREAFRAIFSFGGTLHDLRPDQVGGLENAKENAAALALDVWQRLPKKSKAPRKSVSTTLKPVAKGRAA